MRVGLIGSTGMIGRHMYSLLKAERIDCVCVSRKQWDLCNWKSNNELNQLFGRVDAIFHFGAFMQAITHDNKATNQIIQQTFDVNVRSCLNLAEWASLNNVPIVFLSSSTVYADPHSPKIKESCEKVINGFGGFYGYSKLLAEKIYDHYAAFNLKLIMLRPTSVYGFGLGQDKLVAKYLRLASKNKLIEIERPLNRINLVHAMDVSKAALSALKHKSWGTYNVASNSTPSIQELAELCVKISGKGAIKTLVSSDTPFLRFDLDVSKAYSAFMYEPTISIEEGLALMFHNKIL